MKQTTHMPGLSDRLTTAGEKQLRNNQPIWLQLDQHRGEVKKRKASKMTQITLPTASDKSHQWEAYPFNFMKSPLLSDSLFYLVLSGPWKQIISIVKCVITLEKANTP